jgi:hypothetical protein
MLDTEVHSERNKRVGYASLCNVRFAYTQNQILPLNRSDDCLAYSGCADIFLLSCYDNVMCGMCNYRAPEDMPAV